MGGCLTPVKFRWANKGRCDRAERPPYHFPTGRYVNVEASYAERLVEKALRYS